MSIAAVRSKKIIPQVFLDFDRKDPIPKILSFAVADPYFLSPIASQLKNAVNQSYKNWIIAYNSKPHLKPLVAKEERLMPKAEEISENLPPERRELERQKQELERQKRLVQRVYCALIKEVYALDERPYLRETLNFYPGPLSPERLEDVAQKCTLKKMASSTLLFAQYIAKSLRGDLTPFPSTEIERSSNDLDKAEIARDWLKANKDSLEKIKTLTIHYTDYGFSSRSSNRSCYLPPEIELFTGLKELSLEGLGLSELPPLGKLIQLEKLSLSSNAFSIFPEEIFALQGLKVLSVTDCKMKFFTEWKPLPLLKELDLSNNELEAMPIDFNSALLTSLDLSQNILTSTYWIGKLRELLTLKLGFNKLKRVSSEIEHLSRLKILELSGNALESLPKEIGALISLEILQAQQTYLRTLPEEFGQLVALKRANFSNGYLTALPKSIANLGALQEFNLKQNPLVSLPPQFGDLRGLKELQVDDRIQHVPFSAIPPQLLESGHNLVYRVRQERNKITG